ncbi:hypothetical protein V3481_017450 [Fusarium oxysporum f. sp. vasinfectum]
MRLYMIVIMSRKGFSLPVAESLEQAFLPHPLLKGWTEKGRVLGLLLYTISHHERRSTILGSQNGGGSGARKMAHDCEDLVFIRFFLPATEVSDEMYVAAQSTLNLSWF